MEVKRTFDLLELYRTRTEHDDALAIKRNGKWEKYSASDYIRICEETACGLLAYGYEKGDKIATITNNRPEWNFMDMAMSLTGIVHVPVYPTINIAEFRHILTHSGVRAIIVSDKLLFKKLSALCKKIPGISDIFSFDEVEGVKNWKMFPEKGKELAEKYLPVLKKNREEITEDELVSIIYTSGTTGMSKGVMLSHKNFISNAVSSSYVQPLDHHHKCLSFLPISHVYERMMNYHYQYKGIRIYYAESMGTIIDNIKEIHADGFNTVPRLLEKVFDRILTKGKGLKGLKKNIFFWAVNLGLRFELNGDNGWLYEQKLKIARKLVFSKWNEALGGNVKIIVSGGSALQTRLARIFWAAGLKVIEGYGLTETSPVLTVNHAEYPDIRFGTVGPVLEGVEVKIAEDGEILAKGPNLMMGYYNDPEATKEVIDEEGWFHTGDVGTFVEGRFLKITDRKKEIFKNSAGKYVAPQSIENKLRASFYIEQAMVVGENEKFVSALLSPNFSYLHDWCAKRKIHYRDNKELINLPEIIALIEKEVEDVNKEIGQVEQIKRFRLVCEEWTPASGELSPTLKLKRKFIYKKYNHILEDIYSRSSRSETIDESIKKAKNKK